jgi:hypothetical protein
MNAGRRAEIPGMPLARFPGIVTGLGIWMQAGSFMPENIIKMVLSGARMQGCGGPRVVSE